MKSNPLRLRHLFLLTSVALVSLEGCANLAGVRDDLALDGVGGGDTGDAAGEATSEAGGGDGTSTEACSGRQVTCDGVCVDLKDDPKHCGSCGNACQNGQVCGDGSCSASCSGELVNCNGSCVDTSTDNRHCGECLNPCGNNQECTSGVCTEKPRPDGGTFIPDTGLG